MVSGTHRLLLREGRNNRSNPDFQTFFEGFIYIYFFYIAIALLTDTRDRGYIIGLSFSQDREVQVMGKEHKT